MKEAEIRNKDAFNTYLKLVEEDANIYFKDKGRFKVVPCVCCGSKHFKVQFKKLDFTYVLCDDCGTLYVNPRPPTEDLMAFYITSKSAAFWINEFFPPTLESRREKIFKPRAQYLAQKLTGRIINVIGEIGAGFGLFLEEMKKLFPEITFVAIEPSVEMAKICQEKGFETIAKAIEDLDMKNRFDLLSSFELLEHLNEPNVLFRQVYKMLKPGGLFLLTALNCEGFDIQVLWQHSKNIYPPHHLNFFNPRSLKNTLEDNGFCVDELMTPGKLDWEIVETAIKDGIAHPEKLWLTFSRNASQDAKEDLQLFLSRHGLSSHMMALARKK